MDMQSVTRLRLVLLLALAVALLQDGQAFILPIILPPNLLWYGGYTSSPVLPLPVPQVNPLLGLGGLGYPSGYPPALPGLSPYGAAAPRPAIQGLYPGAIPGLAGRPALG